MDKIVTAAAVLLLFVSVTVHGENGDTMVNNAVSETDVQEDFGSNSGTGGGYTFYQQLSSFSSSDSPFVFNTSGGFAYFVMNSGIYVVNSSNVTLVYPSTDLPFVTQLPIIFGPYLLLIADGNLTVYDSVTTATEIIPLENYYPYDASGLTPVDIDSQNLFLYSVADSSPLGYLVNVATKTVSEIGSSLSASIPAGVVLGTVILVTMKSQINANAFVCGFSTSSTTLPLWNVTLANTTVLSSGVVVGQRAYFHVVFSNASYCGTSVASFDASGQVAYVYTVEEEGTAESVCQYVEYTYSLPGSYLSFQSGGSVFGLGGILYLFNAAGYPFEITALPYTAESQSFNSDPLFIYTHYTSFSTLRIPPVILPSGGVCFVDEYPNVVVIDGLRGVFAWRTSISSATSLQIAYDTRNLYLFGSSSATILSFGHFTGYETYVLSNVSFSSLIGFSAVAVSETSTLIVAATSNAFFGVTSTAAETCYSEAQQCPASDVLTCTFLQSSKPLCDATTACEYCDAGYCNSSGSVCQPCEVFTRDGVCPWNCSMQSLSPFGRACLPNTTVINASYTPQHCFSFSSNETCSSVIGCEWLPSVPGCTVEGYSTCYMLNHLNASMDEIHSVCVSQAGCQFCPNYQYCEAYDTPCACHAINDPNDCNNVTHQGEQLCTYGKGVCTSGSCFSFLLRSYNAQPYVLFLVGMIKDVVVIVSLSLLSSRVGRMTLFVVCALKQRVLKSESRLHNFSNLLQLPLDTPLGLKAFRAAEDDDGAAEDTDSSAVFKSVGNLLEKQVFAVVEKTTGNHNSPSSSAAVASTADKVYMHLCPLEYIKTAITECFEFPESTDMAVVIEEAQAACIIEELWIDIETLKESDAWKALPSDAKRITVNPTKDDAPISGFDIVRTYATHPAMFSPCRSGTAKIAFASELYFSAPQLLNYIGGGLIFIFTSYTTTLTAITKLNNELQNLPGNSPYSGFSMFCLIGFRIVNASTIGTITLVLSKYLHATRTHTACLEGPSAPLKAGALYMKYTKAARYLTIVYFVVVAPFIAVSIVGGILYPFVSVPILVFVFLVLPIIQRRAVLLVESRIPPGSREWIRNSAVGVFLSPTDADISPTNPQDTLQESMLTSSSSADVQLTSKLGSQLSPAERRSASAQHRKYVFLIAVIRFLCTQELPTILIGVLIQMMYNYAVLYFNRSYFSIEYWDVMGKEYDARSMACLFQNMDATLQADASKVLQTFSCVLPFF